MSIKELRRVYRPVVDLLGFEPISVWFIPQDKYMLRDLRREYSKLMKSMGLVKSRGYATIRVKDWHRLRLVTDMPYSIRIPNIDYMVYKCWGFEGCTVYNPFLGYTLEYLVAVRLGMNYLGSTVNEHSIRLNKEFYERHKWMARGGAKARFWVEDATRMATLPPNSVDLVWTSPPYYTAEVHNVSDPNELSSQPSYQAFLDLLGLALRNVHRVLKPERFAVVQVGDVRVSGELLTLGFDTMRLARDAGFRLHDVVILVNQPPNIGAKIAVFPKTRYTVKSHEYILVLKKT